MDRTSHRLDITMDEDDALNTRAAAAAFQQVQHNEQWLRTLEEREQWLRSLEEREQRRAMYIKQRRQQRVMERPQEPYQLPPARPQPATGSLEANKQLMTTSELRRSSRMIYLQKRRQRQIIEQRLEPASPQLRSLKANDEVARMMAAMGHVPGMGKNRHWIVPPPSSHNGFIGVGTHPDFEEAIEVGAARALRDLCLGDEP